MQIYDQNVEKIGAQKDVELGIYNDVHPGRVSDFRVILGGNESASSFLMGLKYRRLN